MAYAELKIPEKPTPHRRRELAAQCERLIDYCGNDPLTVVNGAWCRAYVQRSSTTSMARHDLEIARAAVRFYNKEYGLDFVPIFSLPEKGKPRTGHLTRDMAARLVHAARRAGNHHLARYILIGLYTGTRSGAVLAMEWMPNTGGGWFDLERGLMYRAAEGEQQTKKRKPPAIIPDKLAIHLRRWHRMDSSGKAVIKQVIHWRGEPVKSVKRAWNTAKKDADLPKWVIPHILRHTAITWSMQAGKNINTVSEFYGVSVKVLETTYWHAHPDYQKEMRKAK